MNRIPRGFAYLLLLAATIGLASGCSNRPSKAKGGDSKTEDEHAHPSKGPHGGVLAEWDHEKYHAEFTVDHGKKQATVYILDGSAKKPAAIDAKSIQVTINNVKPILHVELKAEPETGDPAGKSSRFIGTHEQFGKETDFHGEISGVVSGTPYHAPFAEKDDHDHDKKK